MRGRRRPSTRAAEEDKVTVLQGMTKTLAANMDESLTVPTATSVRTIPAKLMIDNRIVINNHMSRTRGGKISFTHLIGWALIRALKEFPSQNVFYAEIDGKPSVVAPAAHQPGHRDRPAQARRHARADGAEHQARRHPDLQRVPRLLRGPRHPRARQQAHRRGLPGHDAVADQPRRHRHRALGAPPDEGAGLHHRRRRPRVSRRVPGREREDAQRARDRQDDHPHQHLRPPRHPGRRLRRVPEEGARAADRAAQLLRGHLRGAAHPVRAHPLGGRHQRRPRRARRQDRPACRSSSTRSACAAT